MSVSLSSMNNFSTLTHEGVLGPLIHSWLLRRTSDQVGLVIVSEMWDILWDQALNLGDLMLSPGRWCWN